MQCNELKSRFSERFDDELAVPARAEFDAHLASCESCATGYQQFQDSLREIHGLPRHPVPRSFAADVTARLEVEDDALPDRGPRWLERSSGWAAAFVLGLLLAVVYVEVRVQRSAPADTAATDTSVQVANLEQDIDELRAALVRSEQSLGEARAEQASALAVERQRWQALDAQLSTARQSIAAMQDDTATLLRRIDELKTVALARADTDASRSAADPGAAAEPDAATDVANADTGTAVVELPEDLEGPPALVMLNTGNSRAVDPNPDHPETIQKLFELYESGHPQYRPLAFDILDQHFREPAREFVAKRLAREHNATRPGLTQLFGTAAETGAPSWNAKREQLVRLYRQYWELLRSELDGAALTLSDLKKFERE